MKFFIGFATYVMIFVIGLIFISKTSLPVFAQNYDRMLFDDGGNSGGGGGGGRSKNEKEAEKIRKGTITNIILDLMSFGESVPIPTGSNTNPTNNPIPDQTQGIDPQVTQPVAGYTPNLPATTGLTQLADRIVSTVRTNCIDSVMGTGSVSVRNAGCLDSLIGIINTSAITELRFTENEKKWTYLQCVACARAMSKARNKPFAGTADYAKDFKNVVTTGYKYYPNNAENVQQHLIPGSLGIYTGGSSGHIYYITEVKRDTTGKVDSVRAFECNYGPSGSVRHNVTRTIYDKELSGWQKPI